LGKLKEHIKRAVLSRKRVRSLEDQ
jgi:hypothetical protein